MKALPESIRDNRITEGKLLRRVERVIEAVLRLHRRTEKIKLFLYHDDIPKGIFWKGCVLTLSDSLAVRLYDAELMDIVAHELAHSYFMDEMVAARGTKDDRVMRVVELKCDAVAMLSLKLLGSDPALYLRGLRRIENFIKDRGISKQNHKTHPNIAERGLFAQRFVELLA